MKYRLLLLVVPLAVVLVVGLCRFNRTETSLSSALCFRQFDQWTEDVVVEDEVGVVVEHRHSKDPYFAFGHMGFGPGDNHFSVATFRLAQRHYRWAVGRDEIPIVLRRQAGRFWLVTFDRTDVRDVCFRFYLFGDDGIAVEVPSDKFPRPLAIQNMWLKSQNGFSDGKPVNEFDIVRSLDPESHLFRESLTAKMWGILDAGLPYEATISQEVLARYKERHLSGMKVPVK